MNDVIIYSKNTDEHFFHVNEVLNLLKQFDVTLTFKKCHFEYFSIKALNHHVFRLKLNTLEKKTDVIKKLRFSKILKELKTAVDFFEYYRKFVA